MRENTQAQPASTHDSQAHRIVETSISGLPSQIQVQQHFTSPQNQQQIVLRQVEALQSLMGERLQQLQLDTERLNHEIHTIEAQGSSTTKNVETISNEHGDQYTKGGSFCRPSLSSDPHIQLNTQDQLTHHDTTLKSDENYGIENKSSSGQRISMDLPNESSNTRRSYRTVCTSEVEEQNDQGYQINTNETTSNLPFQTIQTEHHISCQHSEPVRDTRPSLRYTDNSSNFDISKYNDVLSSSRSEKNMPGNSYPLQKSLSINLVIEVLASADLISKSSHPKLAIDSTLPSTEILKNPLVYILSSPTGPIAILMSSTQNFYTPLPNPGRQHYNLNVGSNGTNLSAISENRHRPVAQHQAHEMRNQNVNLPEQGHVDPQANMRAGVVRIQIGQILWLIIRLVGFFWFFTAGNPSWSRWLLASGLALVIFCVLTGIFNGVAEQVWNPIRRHFDFLDQLGPLHPQNAPIQPNGIPAPALDADEDPLQLRHAQDTTNTIVNDPRIGDLDSTEVGSRIMENRTQPNNEWIARQIQRIRRIEQALILFVASLVPGVSERHIAHREAQANREVEQHQQLLEAAAVQDPRVDPDVPLGRQMDDSDEIRTDEPNQTSNLANQDETFQAAPLAQL